MKPLFVMTINSLSVTQSGYEEIESKLQEKIGEDYHILLLLGFEPKVQVFTNKELAPAEIQFDIERLLNK